jgi:hypothetical protein
MSTYFKKIQARRENGVLFKLTAFTDVSCGDKLNNAHTHHNRAGKKLSTFTDAT